MYGSETAASIQHQMSLFRERVLPNLNNNIKSGNSLIDTDIYDSAIDFEDEQKIKPFNWKNGFPEVFKQDGFDVVIGNPPYVSTKEIPIEQKSYFKKNMNLLQANLISTDSLLKEPFLNYYVKMDNLAILLQVHF